MLFQEILIVLENQRTRLFKLLDFNILNLYILVGDLALLDLLTFDVYFDGDTLLRGDIRIKLTGVLIKDFVSVTLGFQIFDFF